MMICPVSHLWVNIFFKLPISDDPFDKPPCRGCSSYLTEPYIKCAECGPSPFLLCLQVSMWKTYTNYTNICRALFPDHSIWLKLNLTFSVSPKDLNTRSMKVITDMKSWWVKLKIKKRVYFSLRHKESPTTHLLIILSLLWKQTSDFPVLEPGWTAQEEMALLEAVMDCGFGNWWVFSQVYSFHL